MSDLVKLLALSEFVFCSEDGYLVGVAKDFVVRVRNFLGVRFGGVVGGRWIGSLSVGAKVDVEGDVVRFVVDGVEVKVPVVSAGEVNIDWVVGKEVVFDVWSMDVVLGFAVGDGELVISDDGVQFISDRADLVVRGEGVVFGVDELVVVRKGIFGAVWELVKGGLLVRGYVDGGRVMFREYGGDVMVLGRSSGGKVVVEGGDVRLRFHSSELSLFLERVVEVMEGSWDVILGSGEVMGVDEIGRMVLMRFDGLGDVMLQFDGRKFVKVVKEGDWVEVYDRYIDVVKGKVRARLMSEL